MPIIVVLNGGTEEIGTVADAIDFLQRWPVDRRGTVYRTALKACGVAIAAQMPEREALAAFAGFARFTRVVVANDSSACQLGLNSSTSHWRSEIRRPLQAKHLCVRSVYPEARWRHESLMQ